MKHNTNPRGLLIRIIAIIEDGVTPSSSSTSRALWSRDQLDFDLQAHLYLAVSDASPPLRFQVLLELQVGFDPWANLDDPAWPHYRT